MNFLVPVKIVPATAVRRGAQVNIFSVVVRMCIREVLLILLGEILKLNNSLKWF